MEKKKRNKIIFTLIILIVIVIIGYFGTKALVNKKIELNLIQVRPAEVDFIGIKLPENSTVIKSKDTHDGSHSDGELFSEIQLTKEGMKKFVEDAKKTGKWSPLPLPENIEIILYGGNHNGTNYDTGNRMTEDIPKDIKNGIYYVRDIFAENYPKEKDTDINSRVSYNVIISILDFSTRKLYIYQLDT